MVRYQWLSNNSMVKKLENNRLPRGSKIGKNQKSDQSWKNSGNYDILLFEEIQISFIVN